MAKNYNHSDYARNRYASGIVYSGADGVYELTEEAFLASDPTLTHEDFIKIKKISDDDYFKQDRADTREIKHTIPLDILSDTEAFCTESVADEYIRHEEEKARPTMADAMGIMNSCLSETQKRRYMMMYIQNLTEPEIAELEGVNQSSVSRSILSAQKRIEKAKKKYFKKFS